MIPADMVPVDRSKAALVGDASLLTTAAFCITAVAGGMAGLVVGPAAAWILHGRRVDRTAVLAGLIGLVVALGSVGALLILAPLVLRAINVSGRPLTVPTSVLAIFPLVFLAVVIVLDVDALRDLSPARRKHTHLDFARLGSTIVIIAFVAIVVSVQLANPRSEIGDAVIWALGAAAVGALTMLIATGIVSWREKRRWQEGDELA